MSHREPRVLFLTARREDYLADGVFHGLRSLLGDRAVDYPKHEMMYRSPSADAVQSRIRGGGFTLYGLLDDIPMDRSRSLEEARYGEFDLVILANIKESFGLFVEMYRDLDLPDTKLAVLDGDDHPSIYPYRKAWWLRPPWWFLPRAHTRVPYFKREITPTTSRYRAFKLLPERVADRLPMLRGLIPTSFSIPEEKIFDGVSERTQLFGRDLVDPEFSRTDPIGSRHDYRFRSEDEYYADLRRSRFAITTKRGGWDCLRHYEIAANGCVPCFRDLHLKPTRCAPHGLLPGRNCLDYRSRDDLMAQIEALSDDDYERLRTGALAWARENTTVRRAAELLERLGWNVSSTPDAESVEERVAV
jgi:hypothetical protein